MKIKNEKKVSDMGDQMTRLPAYIIVSGWIVLILYVLVISEVQDIREVIAFFLSSERSGIRFRALIFFSPLISTVIGYLVFEREKFFKRTMETRDALDRANDELHKLVEQKDDFIAKLGHDLKTPLTPLLGLLPLVHRKESDARLRELLEASIENVHLMKDLVIKSIKLARATAMYRPDDEKVVDLGDRVGQYIDRLYDVIKKRTFVALNNIPEGVMVRSSEEDLEEVFSNLISNAVKYSEPGGAVIIDASVHDGEVLVSVKDNGLGLTATQLEHVFDAFYKVDESRHELDSSGLGLSICHKIIERQGGRIWAESDGPGRGSSFFLTLKLASMEDGDG